MKKVLSFALSLIMVLVLSSVAFADSVSIVDNATSVVPVSIRQEFIDETPEGHYLADVKYVRIDDDFFQYEGVYLPLVQPRYQLIEGTKYVKVYYDALYPAHIMYYRLEGTFRYDGSSSACIDLDFYRQYTYNNPGGYTFVVTTEEARYNGNQGYVNLVFKVYSGNNHIDTISNVRPTIACDIYGNIY